MSENEPGRAPPRASSKIRFIQVPGWPKPRGYENGVVVSGKTLFIAGQVGWNEKQEFEDHFGKQFAQALDNVLAVVRAAGGRPESVVKMTIYVLNLDAYRSAQHACGVAWRARFGKHYPVMALVGVNGLAEASALLEIETICALDEAD